MEGHPPGNHRVAVDLFRHAEGHHEFHPEVERRVVEQPCPVGFFQPSDHAFERVVRLAVPRFVGDGGRDDFSADVRIAAHDGSHGFEMGLAEEFHAVVTGHGVRILPQVEVETWRGGECAVLHPYAEPEVEQRKPRVFDRDGSGI